MATTADEVWQLLGELIASQKETDRRMQETDRRMQETDRQIRAVNKELGELGNRLGEFVEWQVRPAAVKLFRERGIAVRELSRDVSVDNGEEGIEVDLLVVDTTQAVAIEVKSKLTQRDVDEHLERLGKFKRLLPRYQNIQLLGAVAAMVAPSEIARYAYRQGLFVITQSGEDLIILNDAKFQPKAW
ncbi:hypothetical protein IQ219_03760 [Synechocystis sp. LEGE 06083]|uniref:hypothetical protein n=1 Tax=Synechocystis sp. LEGE 06083 TaxID=915336 RepID=UPI0018801225|nr:hypothetical protein [Synechocystis sp. LEGE 06083]MBE9194451.1 hypothetical protein [Synechocystis sp. LEGE 06083]